MLLTRILLAMSLAAVEAGSAPLHSATLTPPTPEQLEFFEKQVRPVLVERCYRCHSAEAEKLKGGLALDTQDALLKGGESGPVFTPGQPEKSRLLEAISYLNPDLQMPPKGKLPDQEIADLRAWIEMGAPWPAQKVQASAPDRDAFDLEARRQKHWAWKPIQARPLPPVQDGAWPRNPIDRFILARLEVEGLPHASLAEDETLVRRLCFDLAGLPPGAAPLQAMVTNARGNYEQLVDLLLGLPQFGERWGRHWLDLVRYAETLGHEFDYQNPNAWRYRDYVIRALNADVSYEQFVREHIAGDLLERPRRHPQEGFNESVIGPAFYWLGQRDHSPVDVRQHQAELIDNQIDVLTKTFLGLTVSCARCHDHKFDAISTQDYYSLYGILSSSRYTQARIDPSAPVAARVETLHELKRRWRQLTAAAWTSQASRTAEYLLTAGELLDRCSSAEPQWAQIADAADEHNLEPLVLERWLAALGAGQPAKPAPSDPTPNTDATVWADFTGGAETPQGWFFEGEAFQRVVVPAGTLIAGPGSEPLRLLERGALQSGFPSRRLQGVARSPTFTITNRFIHILAAGRGARINVPVANFTMIRDPIYGGLKRVLNHDDFRWITVDVQMWQGQRAFLEFNDVAVPDPADDARPNGFDLNGYLAIQQVVFSDAAKPPLPPAPTAPQLLPEAARDAALASAFQRHLRQALDAWSNGSNPGPGLEQIGLLNWLIQRDLLHDRGWIELESLRARYRSVERSLPLPVRVPSMTDGTGLDEVVFVRGNHRLPGPSAPRRFLAAIAGVDQPGISCGSGRRELAEWLLEERNPLTARVAVNRVWLHLFGRGLVPTPDDFGELGQPPSHPELLDWLAHWFRTEGGWSVKRLVRLLVTSNTYRMSSRPASAEAERQDPDNRLWHRMPVRRLEGEAIRDAILAVSGRLNPAMFGPPVPIHLTEFMDGRGRPSRSGPVDGTGRRSIYVEVRRNFVSPMMRTFDMPVPFTTVGRRTISNVPAQSLILMNDPFVIGEASRWARRVLESPGHSAEERIRQMYQAAFARPVSERELADSLAFLRAQKEAYDTAGAGGQDNAWADLAHVLLNVKEFIFIQ